MLAQLVTQVSRKKNSDFRERAPNWSRTCELPPNGGTELRVTSVSYASYLCSIMTNNLLVA